jgi:hypothetical protein
MHSIGYRLLIVKSKIANITVGTIIESNDVNVKKRYIIR